MSSDWTNQMHTTMENIVFPATKGVYQVREVREFTLSLEKSGNLVKSRGKVREFHRNQGIFF